MAYLEQYLAWMTDDMIRLEVVAKECVLALAREPELGKILEVK